MVSLATSKNQDRSAATLKELAYQTSQLLLVEASIERYRQRWGENGVAIASLQALRRRVEQDVSMAAIRHADATREANRG